MLDPNNPFADLIPSNAAPGVIMGPPKRAPEPTPKDPLDRRRSEIALVKDERELQGLNPDGTPKKDAEAEPKQDERTSAFLATNLIGGINQLNQALKADPSAARPTWTQKAVGIFGQDAKNTILPAQRQVVEDSQLAILDAALTLGTGAAYSREQLKGYTQSYFPQIGDSPEAIAAKQQRLHTALLAARVKAGSAAPQIDEAMKALGFSPDPLTSPAGRVVEDDGLPKGQRWSTEQLAGWQGWLKDHPNATVTEASAYMAANNLGGAENLPEVLAAAKKGAVNGGVDYSKVDEAAQAAARAEVDKQDARSIGGPESDTGVLLKQGATLNLNDEASGIGRGLSYALQGKNPIAGYQLGRDAERIRVQRARDNLGGVGTAIEVGGGFLSANPEAAVTAAAGGLRSLIGQGARQGAQVGALAGFGSGEGLADSTGKAVVGGVAGGVLGGAVSGASGALAARRLASTGQAPDLAAAADAEGVNLVRPMFNDRAAQRLSALEAQPGSGPIVRQGLDQVEGQIEGRVANLGAGGNAMEPGAAGEVVQRAGNRFITRSRGVASRLYDRASRLSNGAQVAPTNAVARIDSELSELNGLPNVNQGEISFMNELRDDLTRGPLTVDTIRNLRTSLRGRIGSSNLTMTQAEARANRVIDAAAQDIEQAVPPAAANAYRRADAFYRERMVATDDLKRKILGPRDRPMSGEDAFRQIKNMANSDGRRLAGLMRQLDGQEQSDVAATIAETLGRRSPDAPFTVDNFLIHSNKLSPSARRTLFGQAGAESIDNLRTLSRALQDARSGVNRSNSARSFWQDTGRTVGAMLLFGGPAGAAGGATTGAATAGAVVAASLAKSGIRTLSARALMSPRLSRWLAELPTVASQAQAEAAARRLGSIAAREPALAGELQPLQRWLTQSPAASAEPQTEGQQDGR